MKLETRGAQAGDLTAIKRLTDECIAPDYYSLDTIDAYIHAERSLFCVVTDADAGGAVIAYLYALLSRLDEALSLMHVQEKPRLLSEYGGDTTVGVYKTACVTKDYRRCGIFSSFFQSQETVLRSRGAKLILVPAMLPPAGVVPAQSVYEKNGFAPIVRIHRPWEDMDIYCPHCGQCYCICDAVLYMKKLDGTKGGDVGE